jgi:alkanesulfonate monooxygenase SsuD/methylene tetrahydromethanopterin reductase-like flavin-dependent oxidoreductase (luciferase family)
MRYALNLPPFGALADVRTLAELANAAEDAGWDGFFIWDHIQTEPSMPVVDPWVALAAMAMTTERIRLGALVTPLGRRRPSKLARETATLDQLSRGRLIVGVGSGSDQWYHEYSALGEPTDAKTLAAMLDEGLDVLTGLWRGEPFSHAGPHYTVNHARFLPTPVQTPRIPIWVGGQWPNKSPMRRAARWDGVCPGIEGGFIQPEQVREVVAYIQRQRTSDAPFDVVVTGYVGEMPPAEAEARLRSYADAGVTWWQEGFWWSDTPDDVHKRIQQGPPAV